MHAQLKWSNRAHTELFPNDGSFKGGDAHWCGYVDLAVHIAKRPEAFTPVDQTKAKAILVQEQMYKLAALITEVQ